MDLNPFDHHFQRDPYPTYAWLREEAPVYHNADLDFWALSRFEDVLAGLHDTATYTSSKGVALEDEGPAGAAGSMIHMDPPDHTQMRKVVARRFTPRRIAELEPLVRTWAGELVGRLEGRDRFDVVADYAARLPATVISVMLGIPADEHEHVREWTDDYLTRPEDSPGLPPASKEAEGKLVGLSAAVRAARRLEPTDDLLSLLVTMEYQGSPLTDAQVIGMCMLLIAGGHETTAKLIANGVRLFGSHEEQRAAVIEHPELMPQAVEELLRFTSPTQFMTRTTTRDVELHGCVIPAGSKVALLLGSGNRDLREFERPDDFDIFRPNPRILAFGHGAHVCLGAAVARLEGRIALQEFLDRFPSYEIDEAGITYMHSGNVQGPTRMPLTVGEERPMTAPDGTPMSAARVAELLGDSLPDPALIPASAFELVAATRALVEAVVMTDVDADARAEAAAEIAAVTQRLRAARRADALFMARHADGRVESLNQAGSGRLNPQAPPIEWIHRPQEPPVGSEPSPVEVRARCTFGPQHGGSPGRVYGGVLACALDEVLGIAALVSGATGMTVALSVSLKAGTPFGVPVDIVARYTGSEGRKSFVSGEVVVDGQVTAEANAIFVGERRT